MCRSLRCTHALRLRGALRVAPPTVLAIANQRSHTNKFGLYDGEHLSFCCSLDFTSVWRQDGMHLSALPLCQAATSHHETANSPCTKTLSSVELFASLFWEACALSPFKKVCMNRCMPCLHECPKVHRWGLTRMCRAPGTSNCYRSKELDVPNGRQAR